MENKRSENEILENLYKEKVKLDEQSSQLHQRVLENMLETLIQTAKEVSQEFKEVYREIYYGGSYFDKLKVKSTPYEYDLNFVFKEPKSSFDICNLGDDFRKPNFATLRTNDHNLTPVWKNLIAKDRQNNTIISPSKMFQLLHRTIDQALTKLGKKFKLDGQEYRLTRQDGGAPIVLKVQGGKNVFFTVDVVPSFKFELIKLKVACNELYKRLTNEIIQKHNIQDVKFVRMNALKNSDKDHFEVAFHDVERKLLARTGGCVLKVVKLMKYLRDITGGTTLKLKSHFIKSVVMAHVLREENPDYWNNGNLATCFYDCTMNLYFALQKQILWDIFYPELNMFDRLEKSILEQTCKWLEKLKNKYLREETVAVFFRKNEDSKSTAGAATSTPSSSTSWSALRLIASCAQMMTGLAISHSSPPQKESKLQCDVCNMIFSGPESQNQHNSSEKHKKKMQATAPSQNAANQSSLSWKESKLECHICDMTFSGPESQKQHNDSEKHKKKASQMFPNTQNINLSCDVCSMTFTGPESKEQHLDSDKHKKKVQSAQMFNVLAPPADPAPSQQLRCDECSMTFTGPESLGQHLNGEKHRKKLQQKMLDGTKLGETAQQKTFSDQVSVFWCKPCNITCTSKVSLAEHEASRNHAKMSSV